MAKPVERFDMSKSTCAVDQCDRPVKSRGWCQGHYASWVRTKREPTGALEPRGRCHTETCSVDGCDLPYRSSGYCAPHKKRVAKYGSPGSADIRPRSVGEDADYGLAHQRVTKSRGKASGHSCIRCDAQAQQWAYSHLDPDEKRDPRGYAYSTDPMHYLPMCIACHKRFDMTRVIQARYANPA